MISGIILTPIAAGTIALFLNRKALPILSMVNAAVSVLSLVFLLRLHSEATAPVFTALGGWDLPLGISFGFTGLNAVIAICFSCLFCIIQLFANSYYQSTAKYRLFISLSTLLQAGAFVLIFSYDLFNLYVAFELIGIASISLMCLQKNKPALSAGLRYFFVAFVGSLLYLLGVALLYQEFGFLDLTALQQVIQPSPNAAVALGIITGGLLLKAAIFPFHFWLPPAHSEAGAPVSAILSAVVVKLSIIVLIRLWLGPFKLFLNIPITIIISILGISAIIFGGIMALKQTRLKRIIAYSTVSQLGYLLMIFSVYNAPGSAQITLWNGIIYFLIAHAISKTGLFLFAGQIQKRYGTDELSKLKGFSSKSRVLLSCYAVFMAGIIGIPPSGGFIAKWQLLKAALLIGRWEWVFTLVIGGLLSTAYLYPVIAKAFENEKTINTTEEHMTFSYGKTAIISLAVISFLLMFIAHIPLDAIVTGSEFSHWGLGL